jgi:hypothetical protein
MKSALATVILVLLSWPALAAGGERDWTIENPLLAGFGSGITVGLCRSCELGGARRPAGPHDPFAMTPLVREHLLRMGARPYLLGQILGGLYVGIIAAGVFFRRLNRLVVVRRELQST